MNSSLDALPNNDIVISVPGATSGEGSLKTYGVYEFPATEDYPYRTARYISPRKATGAMRRLYKIDKFLVFNPSLEHARERAISQAELSPEQHLRLTNFLANEAANNRNPDQPMRYFITDGSSEFLGFGLDGVSGYFPTVSSSNQFRCYFRRDELLAKRRHVELLQASEYSHLGYYPLV